MKSKSIQKEMKLDRKILHDFDFSIEWKFLKGEWFFIKEPSGEVELTDADFIYKGHTLRNYIHNAVEEAKLQERQRTLEEVYDFIEKTKGINSRKEILEHISKLKSNLINKGNE